MKLQVSSHHLYLSTSADFTDCLIVHVNFIRFHMFILVNVLLLETIVVVKTFRSLSVNWTNY